MNKLYRSMQVALLMEVLLFSSACNTWPTIIAAAQAISAVTSIFYPPVGALSALAVNLLKQAEEAAAAYKANKSTSTEYAYIEAIRSIEAKLPDDLAALKIPAKDLTKVTAAVNIILDYVEALGVQVPATAAVVTQARVARAKSQTLGAIPKPMTRKIICARWDSEVCSGDAGCAALLK